MLPLAVGLLVMMYPILCKVKFETLHLIFGKRSIWIQILFSVVVNWIVAPLVMVCVFPMPYIGFILMIFIVRTGMGLSP